MKKLSVIMCNYNYGHWIEESLEAILIQSYPPDEVIVVDDASTDNSIEIIREFVKKYPNIKLICNKVNLGSLNAFKQGLNVAIGDYVYSAGSDDKIIPGFFEKSMHLLSKYPQAGLCCSDSMIIDGEKSIEMRRDLSDVPRYFSPKEAANIIRRGTSIPMIPYTVIMRRSALMEAGGYLPDLKWSADLFANYVSSFRNGFCCIPEGLTGVRFHSEQYGGPAKRGGKAERDVIKNILDAVQRPEYSDVLPLFKKAAVFATYPYPWEALQVVISRKRYWGFFSLKLLRYALFSMVKKGLLSILPASFVLKIRTIVRGKRKEKLINGKGA
ncbi:glycosyltransferase family 2 protein [Candidatus Margulisiibacteriota bacterium]